jgi:hypothetical protein
MLFNAQQHRLEPDSPEYDAKVLKPGKLVIRQYVHAFLVSRFPDYRYSHDARGDYEMAGDVSERRVLGSKLHFSGLSLGNRDNQWLAVCMFLL